MACMSCAILQPVTSVAEQYAAHLFDVLAPGTSLLFKSFVGCWLVWKIMRHGIFKPGIRLEEFLKPILVFTLITLLLNGHGLFWDYIYKPLHQTTMNLFSTIIRMSQHGQPTHDLNGMLQIVEESILRVIQFCERVHGNTGFLNPKPLVAGLILLFPFFFLWAIFVVFTVEYVFKLLIVSAISPLLILSAAFDNTRGIALSGLKVVLQSILTVCISVIAMSITLTAIDNATNVLHLVDGNSGDIGEFSIFSARFCSLFALGMVATLFQMKAPTIASNIIGGHDGPGVSGMIAGSSVAAGLYMAKASKKGFAYGTSKLAQGLNVAGMERYNSIREKLTN